MASALATTALVIALLAIYSLLCWVKPFGNCRRCGGMGFRMKTDRHGKPRRGKPCRRCKATGKRLRIGRRIHNTVRAVHDAGTR